MPIIDLESISVPPRRIRKEFPPEKQEELIQSILTKGNLHPMVVDKDNILLAGERRFRALSEIAKRGLTHKCNGKELRPGLVMVTTTHELSKVQRLEAELEENTVRLNVTWDEKAAAVAQLAELRATQKAIAENTEALSSLEELRKDADLVRQVAAEWRDIEPEEVNTRHSHEVRQDLLVAAWLRYDDPDVRAAPDRKTALKIIERKLEQLHREALAKRFVLRGKQSEHTLLHGNCIEILPTLSTGQFDVLISDPPYGINANKFANQAAVEHTYKDNPEYAGKIAFALAFEGYRITKPKAHAYIFCDFRGFESNRRLFERAGWYVWPVPFVWFKGPNVGIAPRPEHGPRRTTEFIMYCIKGDRRVTGLYPDCLTTPHDRSVERAAHKPAQLYAELLQRSCLPGDLVIDPCCGTGPIFDAARDLQLRATGIEIEEAAVGEASKRIKGDYIPPGAEQPPGIIGGILASIGSGFGSAGGGEGEDEGDDGLEFVNE